MKLKQYFYPESKFGGFTDIDGTITFFSRVNSLLQPSFVVLDVGCGRGEYSEDSMTFRRDLRILRGKVDKVLGIDVDEAGQANPCIDEFRLIEDSKWPVEDNSIDLLVTDFVLEHIEDPEQFFSEVSRVLKDGSYFCARTPNRWNYVALAATLIPNSRHAQITSRLQPGRKEEDVFPTLYRCNSAGKMKRLMKNHGFTDPVVYQYDAEPGYLSFSRIAYYLGVLHQRFAPRFMRSVLFAFGKIKKESTP